MLYGLVMHERDDPELARRAVWLVYLAPPAFVLVMGYAEATFMTFAALVLLGVAVAALVDRGDRRFLAGLTRPVGVLLAVPAAVEGWERRDAESRSRRGARRPVVGLLRVPRLGRAPHARLLVPAARAAGPDAARALGRSRSRRWRTTCTSSSSGDHVSAGMHAVSALVFVVLLVVVVRRWPLSFTLYAAVALVVALEQPQPRLARALRPRDACRSCSPAPT